MNTLPATEKQMDLATEIGRQCADLIEHGTDDHRITLGKARDAWADARRDREVMSGLINVLIDLRKGLQAAGAAKAAKSAEQVTEGMWIVESGDRPTRVFKVQRAVHGSGHLYAKELTDGKFTYAHGALPLIGRYGRPMTIDEAREYGRLYGVCAVCGATLTDEKSIEAGIGPVCATRF